MMAFQAGGPHAQDRGLEAVAYAWDEMRRDSRARRCGRSRRARTSRCGWRSTSAIVPRGIGLVIGCCTFPTWNGFPGFFADLATGNAVVVKPHPAAILPLALTVQDRARGARRGGLRSRTSSRWSRTRPATTSRRSSRCGPRSGSSTSPAARRTATGSRRTRGRRRSTPRSPASTRSSSTRPTTSRASRATSRSRCRSTPGRCARRRRTSTCRRTASTPPTGT